MALDVIVLPGAGCPAVTSPAAAAELCAAPDRAAAPTTLHVMLLCRAAHLCTAISSRDLVRVGPSWRCILCRPSSHIDKDVLPCVVVIDSGNTKGAHCSELDDGSHDDIRGIAVQLGAIGVWMCVCLAARVEHTAADQGGTDPLSRLAPLCKSPEVSVHLEGGRWDGCRHGLAVAGGFT
jgi:hypothetical protein